MQKGLKKFFLQLLIGLVALEILLRVLGMFSVQSEKLGLGYYSYYGKSMDTWIHSRRPFEQYKIEGPEFSYRYEANSLGFRDKEWYLQAPDSVSRLLVLGDSFVEGDGVQQGNELPKLISDWLNKSGQNWEVLNGGICGSDPFFNLKLLQDHLDELEYDRIMMLVNSTDMADYVYRGGMERFKADGSTQFKQGPWWHPFYKFLYSFRMIISFMDYPDYLLRANDVIKEEKESLRAMADVYDTAQTLAEDKAAKLLVVIHPDPNHIKDFTAPDGNILPLGDLLQSKGIDYIDIHQPMQDSLAELEMTKYSWPINGHFNKFGYEVMAACIYRQILKESPAYFSGDSIQQASYP